MGDFCDKCQTNSIKVDSMKRRICRECLRLKRFIPNIVEVISEKYAILHLSNGKETLVDAGLVPILSPIRWWRINGRSDKEYVAGRPGGRHVLLHRFIMGISEEWEVDHKSGDGLDNRLENLRIATHSQNSQNQRKRINSTNEFKCVSLRENGKWRARTTVNGKRISLGVFDTQEAAASAYAAAAVKYHGEFARLA